MAERREAAVLVPVFRSTVDGEIHVILIRKTAGGLHGGQIAFPGGLREDRDATPLDTALRETEEEIGLARTCVETLLTLPTIKTITTGFRVHAFLGKVHDPGPWIREEAEIAEIYEVRLSDLPATRDRAMETHPTWSGPREIEFYRLGEHRVWGLTYRILEPLMPRLLAGEWEL